MATSTTSGSASEFTLVSMAILRKDESAPPSSQSPFKFHSPVAVVSSEFTGSLRFDAFLAKITFSQSASQEIKSVGVGPFPLPITDVGSSWTRVKPRTVTSEHWSC